MVRAQTSDVITGQIFDIPIRRSSNITTRNLLMIYLHFNSMLSRVGTRQIPVQVVYKQIKYFDLFTIIYFRLKQTKIFGMTATMSRLNVWREEERSFYHSAEWPHQTWADQRRVRKTEMNITAARELMELMEVCEDVKGRAVNTWLFSSWKRVACLLCLAHGL